MKRFVIAIIFLGICKVSFASHFTSAQLTYQYITETALGIKYKLRLVLGRECNPGQVMIPDSMQLGIYDAKGNQLIRRITCGITTRARVQNCSNICWEEGTYEIQVSLPRNSFGYFVIEQHCCRTNATNLLDDQGTMAWCQIPKAGIENSAPFFAPGAGYFLTRPGLPDTLVLPLYDLDGDSLAIELTAPLTGGSFNDNFPVPPNTFPGFHPVQSNPGYEINPLGSSNTFKVVAPNGLIAIQCNTAGIYAVAYAIKEYRNGSFLGMTTRESIIIIDDAVDLVSQIIKLNGTHDLTKAYLNWEILCKGKSRVLYLERSIDSSKDFISIDSFQSNTTSCNDTLANLGHTYFYRMRSVTNTGWTFYSNTYVFNYYPAHISDVYMANLMVSPIPVKDICKLSVNGSEIISCSVMDMTGRTVLIAKIPAPNEALVLDCSNLPTGIYTVQILTSLGSNLYEKIIKE